MSELRCTGSFSVGRSLVFANPSSGASSAIQGEAIDGRPDSQHNRCSETDTSLGIGSSEEGGHDVDHLRRPRAMGAISFPG